MQALGHVSLVEHLFGQALINTGVATELAADAQGLGAFPLSDYSFLVVRRPTNVKLVSRLLTELHVGEAESLALAVEVGADRVLIDESQGRRVAGRLGLRTMGVLAMLVEAKSRGMVPAVAPLINLLDARINFRISSALRERVLHDAGESE